jgi:hypothetical protein
MAEEHQQPRKFDELDLQIEESKGGAPVLYVEGIAGSILTNNLVKFNLYHDRPSIRPTVDEQAGTLGARPERRVVATLVMDINNFYATFNMMSHMFHSLVQSGAVAMEPAGGSGGVEANREGRADKKDER